jgi:hypothetical protein
MTTFILLCNYKNCVYNQRSAYNPSVRYCIRPEVFITKEGSCGMLNNKEGKK